MRRQTFTLAASVLAAVLFIGANLAVSRALPGVRLDLTEDRLYTLSDAARHMLSRLVEPVELEFVYSRGAGGAYPGVQAHAARVRELLAEIREVSEGKVILTETNPRPFSADEDRVALAGLQPAQQGGDPLFLGLLGRNSVDDLIVIPFLSPSRDAFLEYDLVRLIAQLDDPVPPVIALVSGLPGFRGDGSNTGDAMLLREIARNFQIRPVAPDFEELPPDADILMLVAPLVLDEARQRAIVEFIRHRGRAFVALDSASVVAARLGANSTALGIGLITELIGVRLGAGVVADPVLALPVEVPSVGGRTSIVGQPAFVAIPPALMGRDDPVTGDLARSINLGAPGELQIEQIGMQVQPLLESSSEAMMVPAELAVRGAGPRTISDAMQPPKGPRVLAARLAGPVRPPSTIAMAAERARPNIEDIDAPRPTNANIIVVADSDFLADGFHIDPSTGEPVADNAAFVLNALDNLAGGSALGELRSRAPATRPMARIVEMRRAVEAEMFDEQRILEERLSALETSLLEREERQAESFASERTLDSVRDPEIVRLREEVLSARTELREIERRHRAHIESVEATVVAINVWFMPALVALAGFGVYLSRHRSRAPKQ